VNTKRKVDVFSVGCSACEDTIALVDQIAYPSCETDVLDMQHRNVAERAKSLGIRSVAAVVIDGELADCFAGREPEVSTLRAAGLGGPI
jgi:glutaredoxin 3